MYYKQSSNVLFRNYESFGYITDNRNFGYIQNFDDENSIGDRILSQSGAVFFSALTRKPQTINTITKKIKNTYIDIDIEQIGNDIIEFFHMLELDGFVVSGKTKQECINKDFRFSYKLLEPSKPKKLSPPENALSEKTTLAFLKEYFSDAPQLTSLHIEITSKCNERCVHCYIPHDSKISHIEPALFYNILRQCKNMNLLHLTLSGGEPMLHPNFCDFLKRCREYDFSINILSNLTLLSDDIIKEMVKNPLLGVQVSLYSMNPDTHDEITGVKGSFDRTMDSISKLIENNIPIQISCPILRQNKDNYTEVKCWAKQYNLHVGDDYTIIARYNHTTQNLGNRLSIDEIRNIVLSSIHNDIGYTKQLASDAEKKKSKTPDDFVCSVCDSSLCITEMGVVYPCAGWQDYCVGNIKTTTLKDIWNHSEKIQYLRNLRIKDFPKCMNCSDSEFCTMCMVRNANEDPLGDPLKVNDYFCSIAKLNKEIVQECICKHLSS